MKKILPNVLAAVGETPLVKLNRIAAGLLATVCVKIEACNPGHSVKDRIALALVEDAERKGLLKPGGTIVDDFGKHGCGAGDRRGGQRLQMHLYDPR